MGCAITIAPAAMPAPTLAMAVPTLPNRCPQEVFPISALSPAIFERVASAARANSRLVAVPLRFNRL